MYRIGKHSKRRVKRYAWTGVATSIVLVIGVVSVFAFRVFTTVEVQATLPAAVVHEFAPPDASDRLFDEANFTVKLPEDWVLKEHGVTSMYNKYTYQATKKNFDNRWLEVYVDNVPKNQSFNRLLPVYLHDNEIIVASSVSENCTAFTKEEITEPTASGATPVNWQGVAFSCDTGNYIRNVVGVGSPENGHFLPLTGPSGAKHTFYFVYVDHNINPDYQILERAIESFTPK